MVTSLLITLFATSVPVFADTLVSGSVYFDSQKTLEEVVKLSAEKDNESILKLIKNGHVSQKTYYDKDIVVLTTGITPESPAQFCFPSGPTTYWTLTKFVTKSVEPSPTSPPNNGKRIWHKVDGKWKWYPANKHPYP